jgi:hypothetical protein
MRNVTEVSRWHRDAQACLTSAQRALALEDHRVAVQNAQLCIELSAKAVIAYFAEPLWRHDPSPQLRSILTVQAEAIAERGGQGLVQALHQLATDAEEAAPWHGWSTYGKESEDGTWIAAVDLCIREVAEDLLIRARRAFQALSDFLSGVTGPAEQSGRR